MRSQKVSTISKLPPRSGFCRCIAFILQLPCSKHTPWMPVSTKQKRIREEKTCVCVCVRVRACVCVFPLTHISIPFLSIFPVPVVTWFHFSIKRVDKMCKPRVTYQDFPDGPVVEDLPASARDTGSIPDLGGSRVPRSNWTCALKLLNQCAATTEA